MWFPFLVFVPTSTLYPLPFARRVQRAPNAPFVIYLTISFAKPLGRQVPPFLIRKVRVESYGHTAATESNRGRKRRFPRRAAARNRGVHCSRLQEVSWHQLRRCRPH